MTLVGYYPLDEDSGTTAYDYSGNENHGTANGAGPSGTGTVAGPLNASAYDFDGTDDFVGLGNVPALDFADESFSVVGWFNTTSSRSFIFGKRLASGDFNGYYVNINSSGILRFAYDSGTNNSNISTPETVTDGVWHQVAAVRRAQTDEFAIYLDGEIRNIQTKLNIGGLSNSANAYIGEWVQNDTFQMDGAIADVRIYDRALSPQEIAYLYQVGQEAHLRTEVKSV